MPNNHLSSQKTASRPYSHSLNSYLLPEEAEWDTWGDEKFVFQPRDRDIPPSQQSESKTGITFLTLSTIILILVTASLAQALPTHKESQLTNINSTTELIKLVTNFE